MLQQRFAPAPRPRLSYSIIGTAPSELTRYLHIIDPTFICFLLVSLPVAWVWVALET